MINEILSLEVLSNLSFKGASGSNLPSRNAALNQAKRDAGVPKSQQPVSVDKVKMTGPDYAGGHVVKDSNGNIVITRQYVTGQYYLRARYYNPVIGRFLQEDTYYGDGLNLYAYCRNNPVRYYDPSGHDACPKALQDQMKGQGIPDVEIAQNVERIQALIADEKLSIEDAYKQVTGRDYPGGGGNVAKGSSGADGATYEGTIYRNVNSQYDPLEMNDYTINSNHRYTKPGTPGLYFSSGEKIVYAELGNYNVDDFSNRTTYSYDVNFNNMLDVSNPKTRDQLGISLGDITGNNYDVTQSIGDYAYSNGYNGIIAPANFGSTDCQFRLKRTVDFGVSVCLFCFNGL